jgi:hypothetical protein
MELSYNPNTNKINKGNNKEHKAKLFTQFGPKLTYVWGRGQLSNPLSNLFLITIRDSPTKVTRK